MFGLLIKKSFYDFWDNLFSAAFLNLGFMLIGAYTFLVPRLVINIPPLAVAITVSGIIFTFLYAGGVSFMMFDTTGGGRRFELAKLFPYIKQTMGKTFRSLLLIGLFVVVTFVSLPFYTSMEGLLPAVAAVVVVWLAVLFTLVFQFYIPMYIQAQDKAKPVLKRAFLFFMDNTFFSISVFIVSIFIFLVSLFTALLIPGISAIFHFQQEAVKMRMKKYDYLEENPGTNSKKVPWKIILMEDKEEIGHRTIKNLIFPWKD
ncbi:hypothetical protein [Spirochaeta cellobiosiphila]|uniref:hypothetical protein n=1 Tax=Spirochaeta cellobiosiphila TaxID=504483 RepID=UPI0004088B74|nr:hypothetical protein [Spirochaeta cellobiosiphila]